MFELQDIPKWLPVAITTVVVLGWFIRLEAKVLYQGKDHEKLEAAIKDKDLAMWAKFDDLNKLILEVLKATSRLEGQQMRGHNEKDI